MSFGPENQQALPRFMDEPLFVNSIFSVLRPTSKSPKLGFSKSRSHNIHGEYCTDKTDEPLFSALYNRTTLGTKSVSSAIRTGSLLSMLFLAAMPIRTDMAPSLIPADLSKGSLEPGSLKILF